MENIVMEEQPDLVFQSGHDSPGSLAFSPDGRYLASASGSDNTVKLWEVETGWIVQSFRGRSTLVEDYAVAFSADGKHIAFTGTGDPVHLWCIESNQEVQTLETNLFGFSEPAGYSSLAFSFDGRYLATASAANGTFIRLWDIKAGKVVQSFQDKDGYIRSVAISPDGRCLVSGGWHSVILWNTATGGQIRAFNGQDFLREIFVFITDSGRYLTFSGKAESNGLVFWDLEEDRQAFCLEGQGPWAVSSDGRMVVSAENSTLCLFDVENGGEVRCFEKNNSAYHALVFSRDGRYLATSCYSPSSSQIITLWDVENGRKLRELSGHGRKIHSIAFSSEGRFIASGTAQRAVDLWDLESGRKIYSHERGVGGANSIAFSPRDSCLAIADEENIIYFSEVSTDKEIRKLKGKGRIRSLLFSPDGRFFATAEGEFDPVIRLWEAETGIEVYSISLPGFRSSGKIPLAFSPDGKYIALDEEHVRFYEATRLWEVISGKEVSRPVELSLPGEHDVYSVSVMFSPNGKYFLSCKSSDIFFGFVWKAKSTVWDVQAGKKILIIKGHRLLQFSRDECFVVSVKGKVIYLWDIKSGKNIRKYREHSKDIRRVEYSRDGRYLISIVGTVINVWGVVSGQKVSTFKEHTRNITETIFCTDTLVATHDDYNNIYLWEVETGREVLSLKGGWKEVSTIAIDKIGQFLAIGEDVGVKIFDLKSGKLLITLIGFEDREWLAFSPEGFFDGTFSGMQHIPFRFPSKPLQLYAPEQFFNQFYQPELISEVVRKGEQIRDILRARQDPRAELDVSKLRDSHMAEVRITSPGRYSQHLERVITIQIEANDMGSGLRDLRVFRNGSLIYVEQGDLERLASQLLYHTQVSIKLVDGINDISAYVFNHDNVRSNIAHVTVITVIGNERYTLKGEKSAVNSIAFSADDVWVASGKENCGEVEIWEVETGKRVRTLVTTASSINHVAFSPDGRLLAAGASDLVNLWECDGWRSVMTFEGHQSPVKSLAFSHDGRIIAVCRENFASIELWEIDTGKKIGTISSAPESVSRVTFSPDGRWIASSHFGSADPTCFAKVKVWGVDSLRLAQTLTGFNTSDVSLGFSPDGRLVACGGYKVVKIVEVATGQEVRTIIGHTSSVNSVAFSPDGRWLASGSSDDTVRIWDILTGREIRTLYCHSPSVTSVAFSQNGRWLGSGGRDGTVKLWEAKTGNNSLASKGVTYLLSIGINKYLNKKYNLNYASVDANFVSEALGGSIRQLGKYEKVVTIKLADFAATRANILSAISRLAGDPKVSYKGEPEEFRNLLPAEPEDLVIIYFAGHGKAQGDRYYVIPYEMGYSGSSKESLDAQYDVVLENCVSDKDFEEIFNRIDAATIMFIIDACESGKALSSEETRLGPLNSRGLAQLAYDKGMYVLVASQSHQAALEIEKLGHGLLTYVVIEEGLIRMKADNNPQDKHVTARELLDYAVTQVPRETEHALRRFVERTGREIGNARYISSRQIPKAYYRTDLGEQLLVLARQQA